ncbi:MAG TPA: hypothetical protein DGH68_07010 [Bacteroidetes bacterium]|jgi:hypothetical protein|nr:hypothetical protein [Bacteroidota bacterium]
MKGSWFLCMVLALTLPSGRVSAQYYDQREYAPSEARYISVGVLADDFSPLSSNPLPDSLAIRYNRIMPTISFQQGSAELFFGYTRYTLSGESKAAILVGGRYGAEVPIVGRWPSTLLLPLQLAADFTKAEGAGSSKDDFNIASIGVGTGLKYRYMSRSLEFSLGVMELAQYSTEGIGVSNGFSAATLGDAILLLRDVAVFDGMVIGYRFRLQTWSMSDPKFNYRAVSHGPYLGIMF